MTMPGLFAAVFCALLTGHNIADHWIQTGVQARDKGLRSWRGRLACLRHTAMLTLTLAVVLLAVAIATGARLSIPAVALGLGVNGITHYWADRRWTLAHLAALTGNADFWFLGTPRPGRDDNPGLGTGAYALDQSWHMAWLLVSALIITGASR
jgi:hypothetical protein